MKVSIPIVTTDLSNVIKIPPSKTVFWCDRSNRKLCISASSAAEVYEQVISANSQLEVLREYVRRFREGERKFVFAHRRIADQVYAYFQAGGRDIALVVIGDIDYLDEVIENDHVSSLVVVKSSVNQQEIVKLCEKHHIHVYLEPPNEPTTDLKADLARWGWNPSRNASIAWPPLIITGSNGESLEVGPASVLTGHAQKESERGSGGHLIGTTANLARPQSMLDRDTLFANNAVTFLYSDKAAGGFRACYGCTMELPKIGEEVEVKRLDGTIIKGAITGFEEDRFGSATIHFADPYSVAKNELDRQFDISFQSFTARRIAGVWRECEVSIREIPIDH